MIVNRSKMTIEMFLIEKFIYFDFSIGLLKQLQL